MTLMTTRQLQGRQTAAGRELNWRELEGGARNEQKGEDASHAGADA